MHVLEAETQPEQNQIISQDDCIDIPEVMSYTDATKEDISSKEETSVVNNQVNSNITSSSSNTVTKESDVSKEISACFENASIDLIHNHQLCRERNCINTSQNDRDRFKGIKDKFQHKWINDEPSFCQTTGFWWLVYMEGVGMYCIICKKHNILTSGLNHYVTGAKRYKKQAIEDHANSANHRKGITSEMTSRVSIFHKEHEERLKVGEDVQVKAFRAAYWLMKEEIPNCKLVSLLSLIEQLGLDEIKFFNRKGQGSLQEIFLLIGETLYKDVVTEANASLAYSLLVDEVTDISVQNQMVVFIQYTDSSAQPKVQFLKVENVLSDSVSANSETLHTVLKQATKDLNGELLSGIVTDGASTMTGKKNGLTARIKQEHPNVISIHCICHRLALACTDSNEDVRYIRDIADILRCLWKFFEDSPKRSATLAKVQMEMAKCDSKLPKSSRIAIVQKVKKACMTRWLSFEEAVRGFYNGMVSIFQCLRNLEKDCTATGLLKKMRNVRFLAGIYILSQILPVVAALSKTFQKSTINFACIEPSISRAIDDLEALDGDELAKKFITELNEGGKYESLELRPTEHQLQEMKNLMAKYSQALKDNIEERFSESTPLFSAFTVFDPMLIPEKTNPLFRKYGEDKMDILIAHFNCGDDSKDEMMAEWGFKYHLIKIKEEFQTVKDDVKTTETEYALQRILQLKTPNFVFPKLAKIAAVMLSLPVSNAWPERGASAVKRIKTRLRNRIKNNMLSTLLQVAINGPSMSNAEDIVKKSVKTWYEIKSRRKLQTPQATISIKSTPENVVSTAEVATQADIRSEELEEDVSAIKDKMNNILSMLKLPQFDAEEHENSESEDSDLSDYDYGN